jgi:hypothetical protein
MKNTHKQHSFGPHILKVEAPQKTNSTFGRWICYEIHSSPFGTIMFSGMAYFWRKVDAQNYFEQWQAHRATQAAS